MSDIKNIVDNIVIKKQKKNLDNNKELMHYVENFIKQKNLILYGGYEPTSR